MTLAQLEYAQKRMEQKWYELAMAEQHGAATPALERLYNAYVLAMEEYNRCSAEYQREHHSTNEPIPVTLHELYGSCAFSGRRPENAQLPYNLAYPLL